MKNILDSTLGFISGSSVKIWFMYSVFNLFKDDSDHRFGADMMLVYGPYIHQNRNTLARTFLQETNKEWLFMVDNDIVFEPKDVWSLYKIADEKGPGIYAGAYLLEDSALVCGPWDSNIPYSYHPMNLLPGEPTQVGVVGAGFTLIHRNILEKIEENWFSEIASGIGEDVSFCHRAREIGYIPWLIPEANPGHFKELVLYPHNQVRNMAGNNVNLVETGFDLNLT